MAGGAAEDGSPESLGCGTKVGGQVMGCDRRFLYVWYTVWRGLRVVGLVREKGNLSIYCDYLFHESVYLLRL